MLNVKMTDVANAAGVSIATVGRVIHKNGPIAEETRERVEQAIKDLGYVPNRMASALKRSSSGIIGCLVFYSPNALYHRISASILSAAKSAGYELITIEGRSQFHGDDELINQYIGMQVDGLVIISRRRVADEMFERLYKLHIPVVSVEREFKNKYVDNLIVRDFDGAYNATKVMIGRGHTRIALISVNSQADVERNRVNGYLEAIRDSGLEVDESLICLMDSYLRPNGYEAMQRLLALDSLPTAVFATADTLASGAMQLLYEKRIMIPDDISIIGWDNVLSADLAPPIDSVDIAMEDIGKRVMHMLKRRIADISMPVMKDYINTIYIDRGTVRDLSEG